MLRLAVDDLTLAVTHQKLWAYAGVILGLVVLEGFFRYQMRMVLIGMSREVEYELRNRVFRHFTLLSPGYYQRNRIGELMSRASNDMAAVRTVLGPGIMYTANTIASFAGAATLMLAISPALSGLALLPLVLVAFLVRHFGRHIHDRFEEVQAQLAELNTLAQESLAGARVVRAYTQERYEEQRFAAANEEYVARSRRLIQTTGIVHPGIQFLMGLGSVIVLWVGRRHGRVRDDHARLVRGLRRLPRDAAVADDRARLGGEHLRARRGLDGADRRDPRRAGRDRRRPRPAAGRRDPRRAGAARPELRLRRRSAGAARAAAHGARGLDARDRGTDGLGQERRSSRCCRGSGTRRLGRSSSTASTSGGSRWRCCAAPSASCRRRASCSRRRCARTCPSACAATTAQRAGWAAELAQLAKDVRAFPRGFETAVGERGITLSGGQKQRAALARALAIDPRILVLDDALSAVDTETEDEILRGLRELRGSRTIVIVSHRVSTVKDADLIVALARGPHRRARQPRGAAGPRRLLRRPAPPPAARGGDDDGRGRRVSAADDDPVAAKSYDWVLLRRLLGYLRPHLASAPGPCC